MMTRGLSLVVGSLLIRTARFKTRSLVEEEVEWITMAIWLLGIFLFCAENHHYKINGQRAGRLSGLGAPGAQGLGGRFRIVDFLAICLGPCRNIGC